MDRAKCREIDSIQKFLNLPDQPHNVLLIEPDEVAFRIIQNKVNAVTLFHSTVNQYFPSYGKCPRIAGHYSVNERVAQIHQASHLNPLIFIQFFKLEISRAAAEHV